MGFGGPTDAGSGGDGVLTLGPDQAGLFGYGSLLSRASMERTLGHPYHGPILRCWLFGWRRTWNAAVPNSKYYAETTEGRIYPRSILYLNVQPDPGAAVNGVIFVVSRAELLEFHKREWIYDPVEIAQSFHVLGGVRVQGGPAYFYVAQAQYRSSGVQSIAEAAVRSSYLRIIEDGLAGLGPEFRLAYERSSDAPPPHLVIEDRTSD
jgi:hypothetical protein